MATITIPTGQSITIEATHGQTLHWEASTAGYITESGSIVISRNENIPIQLTPSAVTVDIPVTVRFDFSGLHDAVDFYWRRAASGAYQHLEILDGQTKYISNMTVGQTIEWYADYHGLQVNSGSLEVRSGLQPGIIVAVRETLIIE